MEFKKGLIALAVLFAFISCSKKEDNWSSYSGTYIFRNVEISQVRMFTKNGEIKDGNTIHHFVQSHKTYDYFILNTDSIINIAGESQIVFLANEKANLVNFSFDKDIRNVIYKNNMIYFEAEDTLKIYHSMYGPNPDNPNTFSYYHKIITYSPLYADTLPKPVSLYYWGLIKLKQCNYAIGSQTHGKGSYSEIKYPLLSYSFIRHTTSVRVGEGIKNSNNFFKENSLKDLAENDTVVIQQLQVIFRKTI